MQDSIQKWLDRFKTEFARDPSMDVASFLDNADPQIADALRREIERMIGEPRSVAHNVTDDFERSNESPTLDGDFGVTDPIGKSVGPYKLLQVIGEGGMGTVYLAEQEKPVRRRVALKIIKIGMDTREVVARFESERQALSMMDHPNIAKVLDVGSTSNGRPFFVMELVKGLPLTEFCDEHKLPVEQRLELFRSVCSGVHHAHMRGIIHRDLKPSNILVTESNNEMVPKIIDFGLAKAMNQKLTDKTLLTELGQVVGTLAYMSPEQSKMNQLDVDIRTDVYSLGVILYELLTGSTPFERERMRRDALDQVLKMIREEDPPIPSLRLSSAHTDPSIATSRQMEPRRLPGLIKGELDWIVMKALEKQRSRRYDSAVGLAKDLERYLSGDPIEAAPASFVYRCRKFVRKNRTAVITGTIVLLSLVVAVIGTSIGMYNANVARAEAVEAETLSEKRRILTRNALDTMSGEMLDAWLLTRNETTENQKKFLKKIIGFYEEFAQESTENDEEKLMVAMAAHRLGRIQDQLGETEAASAFFERAIDILDSVKEPTELHQFHRANALLSIGIQFKRTGNRQEAFKVLFEAGPILKSLCEGNPENVVYQRAFANYQYGNASLLSDAGRFAESVMIVEKLVSNMRKLLSDLDGDTTLSYMLARALQKLALETSYTNRAESSIQYYEEGIKTLKRLVSEDPTNDRFRSLLGILVNDLGVHHKVEGRLEQARVLYEEALDIRLQLYRDFPNSIVNATSLAGTYLNLANLKRLKNNLEPALSDYREAINLCEKTLKRDPDDIRLRKYVRNIYEGIAECHLLTNQYQLALESIDIAIANHLQELSAQARSVDIRLPLRRALILAKQGMREEALSETDRILKDSDQGLLLEGRYVAASVYAELYRTEKDATRKEDYGKRAVELIRKSIEDNRAESSSRRTTWDTDPEFDGLSDRSDFKELADLANQKEKTKSSSLRKE